MAELYIPNTESVDKLTEEQLLQAKSEEIKKRSNAAADNMLDSRTTRSDARKPPTGEPSNQERVQRFVTNRNSGSQAKRQENPADTRKDKIQALREQSDAKLVKEDQRRAQIKAYEGRQSARDEKLAGLGRRGTVTGLGVLGAAVDGLFTYQAERTEDPDGSKLVDLAKAGAVAGAWLVAEPIMWGITLGGMAKSAAGMWVNDAQETYDIKKSAALHVNKDESGSNKGTLGGTMIDNEYAATSRQRQQQIMRNHKIATESILGSEARQLHR